MCTSRKKGPPNENMIEKYSQESGGCWYRSLSLTMGGEEGRNFGMKFKRRPEFRKGELKIPRYYR